MESTLKSKVVIGLGGAGRTMCEYALGQRTYPLRLYSLDLPEDVRTHFLLSGYEHNTWQSISPVPKNSRECVANVLTIEPMLGGGAFIVGLGGTAGTQLFKNFINHSVTSCANFVCFLPFNFEGKERMEVAQAALEQAQKMGVRVSLYPNQDLFQGAHPKESFTEAFKRQAAVVMSDICE